MQPGCNPLPRSFQTGVREQPNERERGELFEGWCEMRKSNSFDIYRSLLDHVSEDVRLGLFEVMLCDNLWVCLGRDSNWYGDIKELNDLIARSTMEPFVGYL